MHTDIVFEEVNYLRIFGGKTEVGLVAFIAITSPIGNQPKRNLNLMVEVFISRFIRISI